MLPKSSFVCPHSLAYSMPIFCALDIRDLSKSDFDDTDRVVMGCAFDCQNDLGRLCDELVYENDMAYRLRMKNCDVHTQVPIEVTHKTFSKTYRLDLVCNHAVYDGKTVERFVGKHDAQVLNYAMLLDIRHIKLLNFRPPRVEGRLKYNALTSAQRQQFRIDTSRWQPLSDSCRALNEMMFELLRDWGTHLLVLLYEEALSALCARNCEVQSRIELRRDGHTLGTHTIKQHHPDGFFVVTAITNELSAHESHLRRLLKLTGLKGLQWINLHHDKISFITIMNS